MSTVSPIIMLPAFVPSSPPSIAPFVVPPVSRTLPALRPVLRRPDPQQGRALEKLAHAIEYLADMRLWEENTLPGDGEAMRLLMQCSRSLFQECAPVVPVRTRLRRWFRCRYKSLSVL